MDFSHWEGDVESTENPKVVTMDEDKKVTAVFHTLGQINGTVNIYNKTEVDTSNLSNTNNIKINKIDKSSYKEDEVIVKYSQNVTSQSIMSIAQSHNMQMKNSLNTGDNNLVLYKLSNGQSVKDTVIN